MLIKPDLAKFAKIKVIGVGGGGCNAINSMISTQQIQGVDFIGVNCDSQALLTCLAPIKVQIGDKLTKGLGAGADPEVGRMAAEESKEKIKEALMESDMVFITAGMGGGTGTGASPIIAEIARELGALTMSVVTKPFVFEGTRRMIVAEGGIASLKDKVDALIVIPNQRLLDVVDKKMTLIEAFKVADSVLGHGVQGISDLITLPGLINVDFADVKAIMQDAGSALMGIG
ncbi:MAG: Cell division protein ftsZ, partial [uncultured bacterium]